MFHVLWLSLTMDTYLSTFLSLDSSNILTYNFKILLDYFLSVDVLRLVIGSETIHSHDAY